MTVGQVVDEVTGRLLQQGLRSFCRLLCFDLEVDSPLETVRSPAVFAVVVVVEGNGRQVVAEGQGKVTGRTEAGLAV